MFDKYLLSSFLYLFVAINYNINSINVTRAYRLAKAALSDSPVLKIAWMHQF